MNGADGTHGGHGEQPWDARGTRGVGDGTESDAEGLDPERFGADGFDGEPLEEELRRAAAILDPVPVGLRQLAVDAYAFHDLDTAVAELTFDSLVDALPVRGAEDVPRMLTFSAGELTVDIEVGDEGLMGQVLPPGPVRIELLAGSRTPAPVPVDELGRFTSDTAPSGPFALRLRTADEVVVTEWLRV